MSRKKNSPLSRRAALKYGGVTVALPMLEAMTPASAMKPSAVIKPSGRMGVFYFGTGMNMRQFTPKDEGTNFTFSRILKPLKAYRKHMTVLSGTYLKHGGNHYGDYTFLTGVKAYESEGIKNSISADQVAAARIGRDTRFPSLQFSVSRGTGLGGNLKTLSWNRNGVPLSSESDPHVIFNKLFGRNDPSATNTEKNEMQRRGSILDALRDQTKRVKNRVSSKDRRTLDQYLTSVRELEKQLQRDKAWAKRAKPKIDQSIAGRYARSYDPDAVSNFHYETYAKRMYDLIALAYQTNSTRIITYVVRRELRGGVYPEFGVSKDYHSLSHHNNDPRNLEELARVDTIYMQHWAHFLQRMKDASLPDGSTLLDHTMLAFSSGMGIGHSRDKLPTALFGGKALGIKHQGHLKLPPNTPLARLWHTQLDRLGVRVDGPFQDSPGPIRRLVT